MNACVNAAKWTKETKDDEDWNRIKSEFQPLIDKISKDEYFKMPANPDLDVVS